MSDSNGAPTGGFRPRGGDRFAYDPAREPSLFDAVLSKRVVAFAIDAVVIFALMIPVGMLVAVFGFITLGIGWLLFGPLFAIVALGYEALTLGGPHSATLGMQLTGVEIRTWSGQRMFPLLAIMHALLFWVSITLLTPIVLLLPLFTYRRQLLHDLVLGVMGLNSVALHRHEG